MHKIEKMTMDEALNEVKCLKKVFTEVRLFDENHVKKLASDVVEINDIDKTCQCYTFWNKNAMCKNCISIKAFYEKSIKEKLEIIDSCFYKVEARYLEIDNKPYVLELIKKIDDSFINDLNETINNKNKISFYYEKVYKDVLTGAYNRRFYEENLKNKEMNAGIAMFDLDDFKLYNDIYGHIAGDAFLVSLMNVIKKHINDNEYLIRFGGDEFLIIIPNINKDEFYIRLKAIQKAINELVVEGYKNIKISVSMGCTICENSTINEAIQKADYLMYQGKHEKNSIIVDDDNKKLNAKNKLNILIVDDSKLNREILSSILKNEYNIIEASSGTKCINTLKDYGSIISLIILDIIMPSMNGFDVLEYLNSHNYIEDIPVIIITEDSSDSSIRKAFDLNASDYINRPFDAKVVYRRVANSIKLYDKQKRLISIVTNQVREKEKTSQMMIAVLSHIVEFRNGESGNHVMRINKITEMLLNQLVATSNKYKLTIDDIFLISTASSLHDIGKIAIDSEIINKNGPLTDDEFQIMKKHTIIGYEILNNLTNFKDEKLIQIAKEICRWHHERYDGNGYPDRLKGDDIPVSAQVVSLADVYDALVSKRVYKDAYPHDAALKMILEGKCGAFNPLLLKCLLQCKVNLKNLYDNENEER